MVAEAKIKITGDPTDAQKAFQDVSASSKELSEQLTNVAKTGAVIFAGLTGAIGLTIAKFRVQEQALFQQEAILKSTGFAAGLTSVELQKMASGLQAVTTFGDEAIISGQNILLTFKQIGKDVFPEVTQVMLDVASVMGTDLKSTSIQLGKALNDPITGLASLSRVGITFNEQQKEQIKTMQKAGNIAGAQAIILKELQSQFGGAAEAAAQGTGTFVQFQNVLGDILEGIGKEFVPLLALGAKAATAFAQKLNDNKEILKALARLLAAGAGMAAFATGAALAGLVVVKLKVLLFFLRAELTAGRIAAAAFTGALTLGLGFVIAFLPEIIEFAKRMTTAFENSTDAIINTFKNMASNLLNIGAKIGEFLKDLFTHNFSDIKASASALKDAVNQAIDETFSDVAVIKQTVSLDLQKEEEGKALEEKQAEEKKARQQATIASTKAAKEKETAVLVAEQQKQNEMLAQQQAIQGEIIALTKQGASDKVIKLKEDELALLRALESAKDEEDLELAEIRLENFRLQSEQKRQEIIAADTLEQEEKKALRDQFSTLDKKDRDLVNKKNLGDLNVQQLQRREALITHSNSEVKRKDKERKDFAAAELKQGVVLANINRALNSAQVQGVKSATGSLVELQNSRSSKLKAIGKAAAITQILIKGAESAVNVFNGFSTIPIIGVALGIAGAAAAISFSLEKAGDVRSAQAGGKIPGFGSGDIVPTFTEPGEIIIPKALSPTFEQQFSLEADPDSPAGRKQEFNFGTIIGTEQFVNEQLIPAIKDATELENADLGVG